MPRKKTVPRATPRRRPKAAKSESRSKGAAMEDWLSGDKPDEGGGGSRTQTRSRGRPKAAVERKPVTVYIPPALHKTGKRKALDEDRTFSDLVSDALAAYLGR